jgi:tRNA pseudouridine13 synthase
VRDACVRVINRLAAPTLGKSMTTLDSEQLPHATAKSLRVFGKVRQGAKDFQVDEIPAYVPDGRGDHLFVLFRKADLSTPEAVRRIAQALEVDAEQAGFAGLKDKHAITTQWASFFGASAERAAQISVPGIEVMQATPHPHKLRTGHLHGNRFRLRVRDVQEGAAAIARSVLDELEAHGSPNYFGEQRFGRSGENLARAQRWIVERGAAPRSRFDRKLMVSVWQSSWFNAWLAARMRDGSWRSAVHGDLMRKEDSGGLFTAEDLDDARARAERFEISTTGPIFGADMRWPTHEALASEHALLDASGVPTERLRELRKLAPGTRRVARIRPRDVRIDEEPGNLLIELTLPKGAYATVVLRELQKPDSDTDAAPVPED